MLAGVVLAQSRHARQLADTQRTRAAADAADDLLTRWWTRPEGVPVDDRGEHRHAGRVWSWETDVAARDDDDAREALAKVGARVIRVELREAERQQNPDEPAIVVELVLPVPDWEPEHVRRDREPEKPQDADPAIRGIQRPGVTP